MQQALLGGLSRALTDERFRELLADFYALRDTVSVLDEPALRAVVGALFDTIHDTVHDRNEILKLTGADDPSVPEVLETLRFGQAFVMDEAFLDAVTALCLFRAKLKLADVVSETVVLGDLDRFLALLGFESVSVLALWEGCSDDTDLQSRIWAAVTGVLYAVRDHCQYADHCPTPPPPPVAVVTSVR